MKAVGGIKLPKAPVSKSVTKSLQRWTPGIFAHHAPTSMQPEPLKLKRPKGGHGPHNPSE